MTENEKLRALLAEARDFADDFRRTAAWERDRARAEVMCDRIDAALAEPQGPERSPLAVGEGTWSVFAEKVVRERDDARAEVERLKQSLAMSEQVSGVLCDDCGWAMKFPGEPCRCEVVKQLDEARVEVARLTDVLLSKHGGEPLSLMDELDEARAEVEKLKLEVKNLTLALTEGEHD